MKVKTKKVYVTIHSVIKCTLCGEEQPAPIEYRWGIFGFFSCKKCKATHMVKCTNMGMLMNFKKFCDKSCVEIHDKCRFTPVHISEDEAQSLSERYYQERSGDEYLEPYEGFPDKTLKWRPK